MRLAWVWWLAASGWAAAQTGAEGREMLEQAASQDSADPRGLRRSSGVLEALFGPAYLGTGGGGDAGIDPGH